MQHPDFSGKMMRSSLVHAGKALLAWQPLNSLPTAIYICKNIYQIYIFSLAQVKGRLTLFVKAAVGPFSKFSSPASHLFQAPSGLLPQRPFSMLQITFSIGRIRGGVWFGFFFLHDVQSFHDPPQPVVQTWVQGRTPGDFGGCWLLPLPRHNTEPGFASLGSPDVTSLKTACWLPRLQSRQFPIFPGACGFGKKELVNKAKPNKWAMTPRAVGMPWVPRGNEMQTREEHGDVIPSAIWMDAIPLGRYSKKTARNLCFLL